MSNTRTTVQTQLEELEKLVQKQIELHKNNEIDSDLDENIKSIVTQFSNVLSFQKTFGFGYEGIFY